MLTASGQDEFAVALGYLMDDAMIGVNILKILFGVDDVEELRKQYSQAKYDAVMDETYPG
jgi:hypothetical protein